MTKTATASPSGDSILLKDDSTGVLGHVPAVVMVDPVTGEPVGPTTRQFDSTDYIAAHDFTGATTGDEIVRVDEYDLTTSPATLLASTWYNVTTGLVLASAPTGTNLTFAGATALTDAQLRASAVPVSLPTTPTANLATTAAELTAIAAQLPTVLGNQAGAGSLGVALSTEDKSTLTGMSGKLPASLGIKAAAASFSTANCTEDAAKIPALGQAAMAASTPVVIANNQTAVPVTLPTTPTADLAAIHANTGAFSAVNTTADAIVKASAGTLGMVNVNSKGTVASTVKLYDGTDNTGVLLATIDSLNEVGTWTYNIGCASGIFVAITGTTPPDVTVSFK